MNTNKQNLEIPNNIETLFHLLWLDYLKSTPVAKKVHALFEKKGETIVNDHVALRTFNHPMTNISQVEKIFLHFGYKPCGEYHFKEKKLYAKHYEHPQASFPKIFISELLLEQLSADLQKIVNAHLKEQTETLKDHPLLCLAGRPWNPTYQEYQHLAKESEYASWMLAHGFKVNHFTVLVNELKYLKELKEVNNFLKAEGIELNTSGGEIKGTAAQLLEQSSTLASQINVSFKDGEFEVPSCYYEFAKRYPLSDAQGTQNPLSDAQGTKKLYQGFIAASADKIFESTDKGQKNNK